MARKTYTDAEIESYDQVLQGFPDTPPRRTRKAVVEKLRDRIIDLLERGFTYEEIQQGLAGKGFEISVHTLKEYVLEGKGRAGKRRARRASRKSPVAAVASPASVAQPGPGPGDEVAAVAQAGPATEAQSGGDDPVGSGGQALVELDLPPDPRPLSRVLENFPHLKDVEKALLYKQVDKLVVEVVEEYLNEDRPAGEITKDEIAEAKAWLEGPDGSVSAWGDEIRAIYAVLQAR